MDLNSLTDQLKNKVVYRAKKAIENAVIDPEANAHAAKIAEDKPEPPPAAAPKEEEEDFADPTPSSKAKKIAKRIWKRLKEGTTGIFLPILFASLIANESIAYPPMIRVAFFIFTLSLCMTSAVVLSVLCVFYLGKAMYHYYVNNMVKDAEPRRIMPAFLAILPIMTTYPESTFKRFMTYPLRYPKTERDVTEVQEAVERYETALAESFEYLEQVKSMPMFAKSLSVIEEWLKDAKNVVSHNSIAESQKAAANAAKAAAKAVNAPLPEVIAPAAVTSNAAATSNATPSAPSAPTPTVNLRQLSASTPTPSAPPAPSAPTATVRQLSTA